MKNNVKIIFDKVVLGLNEKKRGENAMIAINKLAKLIKGRMGSKISFEMSFSTKMNV